MFLVLTGVSHQCHILWQHLSHHLQKIQQILWPPGNHPSLTSSPAYTVQVGFLLKSFPCFPLMHSEPVKRHDCLYRLICKPCDFSLQLCLYSTPRHLYESLCGLVSDWGAGETWLLSVSCIEMQQYAASLSLSAVYLYFSFFQTSCSLSSQLISALPSTCQGADRPFYATRRKTRREINVMYRALWQFLNVKPQLWMLFFWWRQVLGMEQRVALKELNRTFSIKNCVWFESLCDTHAPWTLRLLQTDPICMLDQRVTSKYVWAPVRNLQGAEINSPSVPVSHEMMPQWMVEGSFLKGPIDKCQPRKVGTQTPPTAQ